MIETRGLIPAIEACDVMLKTANVELVGKRKSTATLVTILVTGDVGAVKVSVEAGVAAAEKVSAGSVLSSHVIPRPIGNIERVFGPADALNYTKKSKVEAEPNSGSGSVSEVIVEEVVVEDTPKTVADSEEEATEVELPLEVVPADTVSKGELDKVTLDEMMRQDAMSNVMMDVAKLSVPKLRKLARQYEDLGIVGREISTANKKSLLKHLKSYYSRLQ